ncbi:MAG TPA: WD40 repeat domain-containing protein [Pirellulales bacterium]|nr:WD40 repeat domain-containing protein [Pirellulales bacterium]
MSEPDSKPASDGGAKPITKADPKLAHMTSQWKYTRPLTACRYDPTGRFVFTGAEDYLVQRWNLQDDKSVPLAGHESWVRALACTSDGNTLFSGGYDGRLIAWPAAAERPQPTRAIDAHQGWIRAVAVSPDNKLVASCGNDGHVRLWNTADGKLKFDLAGHDAHVYNVAFHPSGEHVVSCDLKANLKQWDTRDGKLVREFKAEALHRYDTQFRADLGGARCIAFNNDGSRLAVGGVTKVTNAFAGVGEAALVVIDWQTGKVRQTHAIKESLRLLLWGAAWHADGYWIGAAGGSSGGFLVFWKPDEEHEFFRFKLPDTARDLSLAPDGMSAAVAHADMHLRVYRLAAKS